MLLKQILLSSGLIFTFISTASFAAKPTESEIFHCGCEVSEEGTETASVDLVWHNITVSPKSRGHRHHTTNDIETCTYMGVNEFDEPMEFEEEFERGFDDCVVTGSLIGVADCSVEDMPVAGDMCTAAD